MFQTLFGVNMSIFKGAMVPRNGVTFFLAGTSVSTLSITIQSKKFTIFVIALFDNVMLQVIQDACKVSYTRSVEAEFKYIM